MTRKMADDEAKRSPLNLRTTRAMRENLERAAAEGGRSLTQEAERRLEASFAARPVTAEDVRLMVREEIRAAFAEVREPIIASLEAAPLTLEAFQDAVRTQAQQRAVNPAQSS